MNIFETKMMLETVYIVFVGIHALLAAYVVVTVFKADLAILKNYNSPLTMDFLIFLQNVQRVAKRCLIFLWVTGLIIVGYRSSLDVNYLYNPKLWMKFITVSILTLNGFLLHKLVLNNLKYGDVFAGFKNINILNILGVVSSVSWGYACFLGIARGWNDKIDFASTLFVYLMAIITSIIFSRFFIKRISDGSPLRFHCAQK